VTTLAFASLILLSFSGGKGHKQLNSFTSGGRGHTHLKSYTSGGKDHTQLNSFTSEMTIKYYYIIIIIVKAIHMKVVINSVLFIFEVLEFCAVPLLLISEWSCLGCTFTFLYAGCI
jgi:hypothetical protein